MLSTDVEIVPGTATRTQLSVLSVYQVPGTSSVGFCRLFSEPRGVMVSWCHLFGVSTANPDIAMLPSCRLTEGGGR